LESQNRDNNFLLRETARKINDATSSLEARLMEEIERLKIKNDDNINQKMDKIIGENAMILEKLNKVITGDDDNQ
jgi:hypothetical protein